MTYKKQQVVVILVLFVINEKICSYTRKWGRRRPPQKIGNQFSIEIWQKPEERKSFCFCDVLSVEQHTATTRWFWTYEETEKSAIMRPLTEEETRTFFEKLAK